jgi:hypothetical protein
VEIGSLISLLGQLLKVGRPLKRSLGVLSAGMEEFIAVLINKGTRQGIKRRSCDLQSTCCENSSLGNLS